MVSDDLLLSYCLKYKLKAAGNEGTIMGLTNWIKDNVLVDQERILDRLKKVYALKSNTPVSELIKMINDRNSDHSAHYQEKNDLLDESTIRGSLQYLAMTSHSVSRQKLYELSPNVKKAFMSCLGL